MYFNGLSYFEKCLVLNYYQLTGLIGKIIIIINMLENIQKALHSRYTVKSFEKGSKIDQDKYQMILESIRMTPTSFGMQAFKVIEITDEEKKIEMQKLAFNQAQVGGCEKLLVFAVDTDSKKALDEYIERIIKAGRQDEAGAKGFGQYISGFIGQNASTQELYEAWACKQIYIALGFALETACLLGVESAPMEGFMPSKVDEYLGLGNEGLKSVVLLTLGVGSKEDSNRTAPKVRKTLEEIVLKK